MTETHTLSDIAERMHPKQLPAVRLPGRRRGIVLGRNASGTFVEIGDGGIVIPHKPDTPAELITDPAERANALTDAFAGTRATYLWMCQQAQDLEQRLADERNQRLLRDAELQQFLTTLVDAGRLDRCEAHTLLSAQLTPLPQPRLRVTIAVAGTFDIEGHSEPADVSLPDVGDLLTADLGQLRNAITGGSQFHVAAGPGLQLTVAAVERITEPS